MIDHAAPVTPSDTRFGPDRTNFLTSHRAQSVGTREFNRLSDTVVALTRRIAQVNALEAPVTRLAPDRCIVQLGPVALTVAHIRNGNDVPPGGQLLAIIWEGTIAPRGDHVPERNGARRVPPPPVSVWEEASVVSAAAESSWHWHPHGIDSTGYTSPELAERCVAQLQAAFEVALRANPGDAPLS